MKHPYISVLSVLFAFGASLFIVAVVEGQKTSNGSFSFSLVAFAEDEDEDDEDEEDERDPSSGKTIMQTITQQVTTYEIRRVNDPEFLIDSDGDLLVDAIDPDPSHDQREYFTDTDMDGVPNIFDKHHDEDDFAYHDDTDLNGNGILDSYEQ